MINNQKKTLLIICIVCVLIICGALITLTTLKFLPILRLYSWEERLEDQDFQENKRDLVEIAKVANNYYEENYAAKIDHYYLYLSYDAQNKQFELFDPLLLEENPNSNHIKLNLSKSEQVCLQNIVSAFQNKENNLSIIRCHKNIVEFERDRMHYALVYSFDDKSVKQCLQKADRKVNLKKIEKHWYHRTSYYK